MDPSKNSQTLITPKEREYLAKLCWLLSDVGTRALRVTFDSTHPPIVLKDHLVQNRVKAVLFRLYEQKILTSKQWKTLYPHKKRPASSQRYDSKTLVILLETICHLCRPYPNGWTMMPLQTDLSLSADIVRLHMMLVQIGSLSGVRHEEFPILWDQVVAVLLRLGGRSMKLKIEEIDKEVIPQDKQNQYIQLVKEEWASTQDQSMIRLRRLDGSTKRSRSSNNSLFGDKKKPNEKEGLSLEDKTVITKMTKVLVDNVIVEDILDRLQQGQIIKIADRQEIMSYSKNNERMNIVLEKMLSSKMSYALKLLCDALKFKYPRVYETVMKCRKTVYKQGVTETVDVLQVIQDAMSSHYRNVFSKYNPLPWNDSMHMNVCDYYTPVDIVNEQGQKQSLCDILPIQKATGTGTRILLEGCSGSGKSTLAAVLGSLWATQKNFFKQKYDFLICIDAQILEEDFFESVHRMVLPENTSIGVKELWSQLEANARDVLFLIDGFDDSTHCEDLQHIIKGTIFRQSAVVLFVTPEVHFKKYLSCDYKLFNTGLGERNRIKFVKSYAQLSKLGQDEYEQLNKYMVNPDWKLQTHLSSPFVCLMLLMLYQGNTTQNLLNITTLTSLFEQFAIVMAGQFCEKQNLDCMGSEFPEIVTNTIRDLEEMAFNAVVLKQTSFEEEELFIRTQNVFITKFGALNRNNPAFKLKFLCSMVVEFLAARYIADMTFENLSNTIAEHSFLTSSRYAQLISFLCGLFREDMDTQTLSMLFQELNRECFDDNIEIIIEGKNNNANHSDDIYSGESSGHILNYSHSLHGVAECHGKDTVTEIVAKAIAQRLFIRRGGMLPQNCILGISYVFESGVCNVTHVDINLLPVYLYQSAVYYRLAEALGNYSRVQHLKVYWLSMELMAKFLSILLQNKKPLESLRIQDCTKTSVEHISAVTWSDLQESCQNCINVKRFLFLNCTATAVVYHVIHHLPCSIEEIDLSGCTVNLMCAGEIEGKLECSHSLRSLNLSVTNMHNSDLDALAQGIKRSTTLQELDISSIVLDIVGIVAIAESIKLSTSLQRLDLSYCELTVKMCQKLADALRLNRSLRTLVLHHSKVSSQGRLVMLKAKMPTLKIVGP